MNRIDLALRAAFRALARGHAWSSTAGSSAATPVQATVTRPARAAARALALLLASAAPFAAASLVRINAETTITPDGAAIGALHAYEVNPDTGEYLACYGSNTITCHLYGEDGQMLRTVQAAHPGVNILTLDASIAANGDFYIVVMTQNNFGARQPVLHGWSRDGASLVSVQVDALLLVDAAVAATESGAWVGTGSFLPGGPPDRIEFNARYYLRGDAQVDTIHVFGPYNVPPGSTCTLFDQESDIAANRAGDVAMAWLVPSSISHCDGTIMARTMRAGGYLSAERRLSTVVRDNGGHDVSPNRRPQAVALEDGRFVVAWSNNVESVSAVIGPTAALLETEASVMPGAFFSFAANPANGDYIAITRTADPTCLQAQLAIEAQLVPQVRFDTGHCTGISGFSQQFLRDGELSVLRAYANRMTLSRVELPAQIEVNNVSALEGNSNPTAPAAISVTLTKPHPNGEDVQVSYFTRNGTAVAGQDFAFTRDTTVFSGAAGETEKPAIVSLIADTTYEDDERFTVDFELASNAVIRRGEERASVLIQDDDSTPPITPDCDGGVPQHCRTAIEPGPGESVGVTVTLQMAAAVGSDLQINYSTIDGSAIAGVDYVARSGTLQITAGSTAATIELTVLGDDVHEATENFRLRLSAAAGVTLSAADLVIDIENDPVCFLEVSPPAIVARSDGGPETIAVTTAPGCEWSAVTSDPWLTLTTPPLQQGNGSVILQVAPFHVPGLFERNGSVTITLTSPSRSITVPVDQDGDCQFEIAPASQHFAVDGGEVEFTVHASVASCAWEVVSPAPWITVLEPVAPVSGNGTVRYRVDANAERVDTASATRQATLGGELFEHAITQDGCSYAVDPLALSADAAGDVTLSVDTDAPQVCRWTALSHASWILVQDGASGSGEGTTELFVLDNPTVQQRQGTVSIGDKSVTVTQDGLECDYSVSPASIAACPDGRAFTLAVTATDGCDWTLHSSAPWAHVLDGQSGTGDDSAQGAIDANLSESPRMATLQLRAQNIGVTDTSVLQEGYLTYELFNATRPSDFSYAPDAAWSVVGGELVGAAGQGTAIALDTSSTCSECEVSARLSLSTVSSAPMENLALLGWYRDDDNHVALSMDEFSNRWTLAQVIDGTRFSVDADVGKILPNAYYDLHLVFDGASFVAELGGQPLLSMPLQGDPPSGSAGLRATAATARLSELRVNAIEASPDVATPLRIFASRFERGEIASPPVTNASQCRLLD